jgi:hypothetical protein
MHSVLCCLEYFLLDRILPLRNISGKIPVKLLVVFSVIIIVDMKIARFQEIYM